MSCSKQDEATFDLKSREFQRTATKKYSKMVSENKNSMNTTGNDITKKEFKKEPIPSLNEMTDINKNKKKIDKKKIDKKKIANQNKNILSFFSLNKTNYEEKYNSCETLLKINKTVISEQSNKLSEQDALINQINSLKNNLNIEKNRDKQRQIEINALRSEIYRLEKLVEILSLEIE